MLYWEGRRLCISEALSFPAVDHAAVILDIRDRPTKHTWRSGIQDKTKVVEANSWEAVLTEHHARMHESQIA